MFDVGKEKGALRLFPSILLYYRSALVGGQSDRQVERREEKREGYNHGTKYQIEEKGKKREGENLS